MFIFDWILCISKTEILINTDIDIKNENKI